MDANLEAKVKVEKLKPDKEAQVPGKLEVVVELVVRKADGTVRERRELKSESFVRQFLDLMIIQMEGVPFIAPTSVIDTGNVARSVCAGNLTFAANAPIGDASYGLVAGTGTTAPTIDNYALETQIAHGVGAGQLQYGNVAFGLPTSDATTSSFTITRDFSNASGGSVTVNELGLYVKAEEGRYDQSTKLTRYFMTIRDTISGGITIPNGETLTVNYRFQAVV